MVIRYRRRSSLVEDTQVRVAAQLFGVSHMQPDLQKHTYCQSVSCDIDCMEVIIDSVPPAPGFLGSSFARLRLGLHSR